MAYKFPFVDLPKHFQGLRKELQNTIDDVLFNRADLIMRGDLRTCEEKVASFVGTRYAVGLNSGTDALFFSLLTAGVGKGDEVITVAHTFVATLAAIAFTGAKPVLVDVSLSDHLMDVEKIEKAITKKTKAIIPVHLNGRMCDMEKIMSLARKHKLIVIEDSAQALGAAFKGKRAGSFGLTGCFSFYPMKILGSVGDGGMLVTNSHKVDKSVRLLRDHSQNRKTGELLGYGYNSRLDNFHAAVINVKLKYLPRWIERRREIARLYEKGLGDVRGVSLPPAPARGGHYFDAFQNYAIRASRRDALVSYLKKNSVETLISWRKPNHKHKALGLTRFNLPMTEKISREVVSLPMNTEAADSQINHVIRYVRQFYGHPDRPAHSG